MGEPAGGRLFPYIHKGWRPDETGELYRKEVGIIWAESM